MRVVDVVEALVPRLDADFLEPDDGLAEAAPEAALAVAAHAALLALILDVLLVFVTAEVVRFVQMGDEELAAVAEMAALFGRGRFAGVWVLASDLGFGLGAFPGFDLVVHGVFVAFPVVFAAEAAWAVGEGAAVGTGMALEVFAAHVSASHRGLTSGIVRRGEVTTYVRSH